MGADNPPSRHEDWLYLPSGERLHRIREIEWEGGSWDEECRGEGVAVCGVRGEFSVPGFISRMGMPRCTRCCARLGIPRGEGNTLNAGITEPQISALSAEFAPEARLTIPRPVS